jgi:hypothetical protein
VDQLVEALCIFASGQQNTPSCVGIVYGGHDALVNGEFKCEL